MAHEAILQTRSWAQHPGLMGEYQERVQVSPGAEPRGPRAGGRQEENPPWASVGPPHS